MTPMFQFADDYVTRWAALDPVGIGGFLSVPFKPATDYSPSGHEAWADLMSRTLSELDSVPVTSDHDRLCALHLRERLESRLAWHQAGEPLRDLRSPFGLVNEIRDSVDLMPRDDDEQWRNIAARLQAIPEMFSGYRTSLDEGLARGLLAPRRQAVEGAIQADRYAEGTHDALVASYGDGPLTRELASAAEAAHASYADLARYLREGYAPRAAEADAAGAERYAIAARLTLGAELDAKEAYEWGWAELARIDAEMAAEADRVRRGASVDEAIALLDESVYVVGEEAYLEWLKARHAGAIEALDGNAFDIAPPLRSLDVVLAHGSTSGAAYYTPPSEDLSRPGRTWWPLSGRERFNVWHELTTVFHEGVPGHHLQLGAAATAGDSLSRFAKCTFVSGHGEGWALYAERLADELGWFEEPGTRLGMLASSATRAARVVIDIGVHLDIPLPDGSRWTFDKACEVLRDRGRAAPARIHAEVVRYFGWPAQAIAYKLGERAWLEARAEAARRPGFDLKRWHTAALSLGPIGLANLATELRAI